MSVKLTTAYKKIKALDKRYRLISGGMSSSKTFSISILLFEYSLTQPNIITTILTQTFPMLMSGVIRDFQSIFAYANLPFSKWFNKSSKIIHFPNGSIIEFKNLDALDENAGRGGRRDYLYCNEANRLTFAALDPFIVRTDKAVFMDWNPSEEFFVYEKFIYDKNRTDVDHLSLTYRDNELIPAGELETIQARDKARQEPDCPESLKNWCRIFIDGELGTYSERRIYDYKITEEIPITARRIFSGMDFGESPDKTALVDLYVDGSNLYLDERFCLNNLRQERIQGDERMCIADQMELIKFPKGQVIIADSSGAVAISDLRKHGYNVVGVKKTPQAQKIYINKLRGFTWHITTRSHNIKKDIESFYWKVDKNGKIIPEPDGHEPDTLVSVRYAIMAAKI